MSLVNNLEKLSGAFTKAAVTNKKIEAESRSAKNPGLYRTENMRKNIETLESEIAEIKTNIKTIMIEDVQKAFHRLDDYYKSERGEDAGHHFLRSQRIENAKDLESGIAAYKRSLDRMPTADRKRFRYVYDDALQELQARVEPHAGYTVEEVIDGYRDGLELSYIAESKISMAVFNQIQTLNTAIEMQLQSVKEGNEPATYSWAQIISEIRMNAKNNVYGPQEPEGELKAAVQNPYDEEKEPVTH